MISKRDVVPRVSSDGNAAVRAHNFGVIQLQVQPESAIALAKIALKPHGYQALLAALIAPELRLG